MNDEIDKINEINNAYKKDHESVSPGDQSQWRNSKITTNEEDNKRSMAQGIIDDLANQRNDIDQIKAGLGQLAEMTNQLTQAVNNLGQGVGITPNQTQQQGAIQQSPKMSMDTMVAVGDIAEKLLGAYKNLRGNDNEISDEFTRQITQNAKNEALESLNIVSLINKKVKGRLVQDIAGDIAGHVLKDDHAPQ